jgi:hypothetical protein
VRDCRVQLEKAIVLIHLRSADLAPEPCKACAGWTKTQSCDSEQKELRLLLQGCAESKLQHLDVVEDFPQGVHAKNSFEGPRSRKEAQKG